MPCRNAAAYVAEAVESCLEQEVEVEVVAVDDGSTDETAEVLRRFGPPVTVLTAPARGAPTARNMAFEASTAPFIQYLDADDVILPGKLVAQLSFLETMPVDTVYGDWRYRFDEGGAQRLGPVQRTGSQDDPVEALLDDWWMPSMAPLHRREAVEAGEGWDPSIPMADDHDFLLSLAITGARLAYQPGCHSLYRRHSDRSVSRVDHVRWLAGRVALLDKAETSLARREALTSPRRRSLARSYLRLARWWWDHDRDEARRLYARARGVHADVEPDSIAYRALLALTGFDRAEQVASIRRRALRGIGRSMSNPHPSPGR